MIRLMLLALLSFALALPLAAGAAEDAGTKALQGKLRKEVQEHKGLSATVKAFASKTLLSFSTNAVFIKAIEAQNAKKMPLAEIQAVDRKWMAAEEKMPLQSELQTNACAKELGRIVKEQTGVDESFVMDDQGANVCMVGLTSDYWQGDEEKWQNAFNKGQGGVDAGKVKFDKSANTNLQQVSLPIIGKGGKVIGAVTWGLVVDKL